MSRETQVLGVKPGYVRRGAVLVLVAFAGCTYENHRECEEFPTIHGPCSWAHSVWQTLGCFTFAAVSMAVMLFGALWVAGVIEFGAKR